MIEREWRPPRLLKPFLRLAPWGFPRQILMILTEGDKTLPEIRTGFTRLTRPALLVRCRELLNVQDVPILRELGWGKGVELEQQVVGALARLGERGLVTANDVLQITEKGRSELNIRL